MIKEDIKMDDFSFNLLSPKIKVTNISFLCERFEPKSHFINKGLN